MAGSSLLILIDDITLLLDDVAAMSKVAAKKTAGYSVTISPSTPSKSPAFVQNGSSPSSGLSPRGRLKTNSSSSPSH
jgi:hypothetical protein